MRWIFHAGGGNGNTLLFFFFLEEEKFDRVLNSSSGRVWQSMSKQRFFLDFAKLCFEITRIAFFSNGRESG